MRRYLRASAAFASAVALGLLRTVWALVRGYARFVGYLLLATNPLTIALWMMLHRHRRNDKDGET